MTAEEKSKVASALTEKSTWMSVGLLPIRLKPITLGQIFEMGEYVNDINSEGLSVNARINTIAEMLLKYKNAPLMQEIFIVCAFRSRWMRKIFRRYILKRLTVGHFQKVIEHITKAYTANFFLTSIIFLHQTKPMTEPKQTTPLGQQSEE